jgi:predicted dehydrogenase
MKPKVVIIGAGGHAKIVCDLILKLNKHEIIGFADISEKESMSRKTDSIFYLNFYSEFYSFDEVFDSIICF